MDDKNEIDSSIQHNLKIRTSSNVLDREPKESLKEEKSISINTVTETGEITKQNLKKDESGFNNTEQKDMATQSDNDDGSIIERNKTDTKEDDKSKVIKNTIFSSFDPLDICTLYSECTSGGSQNLRRNFFDVLNIVILLVLNIYINFMLVSKNAAIGLLCCASRGEEGQPQQFHVRATLSSFSRPSHLEILVLSILLFLKCPDKPFFKNQATLGHK